MDLAAAKRSSDATKESTRDKTQLKHTLRPIDQVQQTKDRRKLLQEHGINLEPLKRDEHITEINLRSMVQMDNEPQYLMQAFQGSLIVTTNEYLTREPQIYEDNDLEDEQYVRMFQIFGIPGLNQRAREVCPFKTSLTSSGLFILLSRSRILFWAGS